MKTRKESFDRKAQKMPQAHLYIVDNTLCNPRLSTEGDMSDSTEDAVWVRHRYSYDPDTGAFLWRNPPNKAPRDLTKPGSSAGTINPADGMLLLRLGKKSHSAARLAWLYVYGEWPPGRVLYRDTSLPLPARNRLSNLRIADMHDIEKLTAENLRAILSYDGATGVFRWLSSRHGVKTGAEAGGPRRTGASSYRYVRVEGTDYLAQRLAWLYVHGEWPSSRVEFKNGDTLDCRIENLAEGGFEHGTRQTPLVPAEELIRRRARTYRAHDLMRTFGISESDYQAMFDAQGGRCAICGYEETARRKGKLRNLAVDHDHATGEIRALLCANCNAALGLLGEDAERMEAMIAYVKRYQTRKESA